MAVDRGAIDAQLRDIGEGDRWWEQREFRELPYILYPDEVIRGVVNGRVRDRRSPRMRPTARWLIVATDQRVICLKQQRFGRKQIDVPWSQLAGIEQRSRLRAVQIVLEVPPRKFKVSIRKADAFRFLGVLSGLQLPPEPDAPNTSRAVLLPRPVTPLPGVSGIMSRILMLSPPDYVTREELMRVEESVERLEAAIGYLRQQTDFLENLLNVRTGGQTPHDDGNERIE